MSSEYHIIKLYSGYAIAKGNTLIRTDWAGGFFTTEAAARAEMRRLAKQERSVKKEKMSGKRFMYRDKEIFVSSPMGGPTYCTVWQSEFGGTHRLTARDLPVRDNQDEAQRDLNHWAWERQLTEVKN